MNDSKLETSICAEYINDINNLINDYFTDSVKLSNLLNFIIKFKNKFSFNNLILIYNQKPEATLVKPKSAWENIDNVKIKDGEKPIKIFVPCEISSASLEADIELKTYRYFQLWDVYDISQTTLSKSEYPNYFIDNFVKDNNNKQRNNKVLNVFNALKSSIETRHKDTLKIHQSNKLNDVQGFTNLKDIFLNDQLDIISKINVLAHEYIHYILKHDYSKLSDPSCELLAELGSYVICKTFGIETKLVNFGFLGNWIMNTSTIDKKKLITDVSEVSKEVVSVVENFLLANLLEQKDQIDAENLTKTNSTMSY
ncbi:hypothetical protein NPA07_03310 [Mycoplasmopsis caviae]|uniref:IrrE N-terminal-like domain-containing protein n=1 Tax=Mycoplasmopsis caviae TaxID=55603 RepID=A0A3P8LBA8_9BACT|nr:hypothetical protein [Mycoplasmopsis caviae]UUD34825.1 hypothetical protein NPA07_03310 [Mycoplasmopsis caviae]VDR42321.1 Uncharacterised protein [Mycoplasmopsis caviae]